jgi:hypothetical protein
MGFSAVCAERTSTIRIGTSGSCHERLLAVAAKHPYSITSSKVCLAP